MNDVTPPSPPPSANNPLATILTPEQPPEPEQPKNSFRDVIFATAGVIFNWFIVPIGIVLILHNFVFQAFHVVGSSMVPYLHETDYLIVSKVQATVARASATDKAYIPKRGEVIVFRFPRDPNLVFVKRVVGVPGDRVVVKDGRMTIHNTAHINGYQPDSFYNLADSVTLGEVDTVVPNGHVFVVGDNRAPNGSFDSREWGALPSEFIIGKAILRLLPLDQMKIITNPVEE